MRFHMNLRMAFSTSTKVAIEFPLGNATKSVGTLLQYSYLEDTVFQSVNVERRLIHLVSFRNVCFSFLCASFAFLIMSIPEF